MTSRDAESGEDHPPDEADYLRTEFLERIAHELRGPAGVTLGTLDEMELALGPDADKIKQLMAMARRGARRVLRTAERLSRTAQLVGEHVEWSRAPSDLKTVLQRAVREAELTEARRGISVVLSVPSQPCTVAVDAPWLAVAVIELVVNAIAHARKVVSVTVNLEPGAAVIAVTDDGVGFAGPVQDRFAPPRDRRGLGLSLSIVKDVAVAHGGTLSVDPRKAEETTEARGATVRLTLPYAGATSATVEPGPHL